MIPTTSSGHFAESLISGRGVKGNCGPFVVKTDWLISCSIFYFLNLNSAPYFRMFALFRYIGKNYLYHNNKCHIAVSSERYYWDMHTMGMEDHPHASPFWIPNRMCINVSTTIRQPRSCSHSWRTEHAGGTHLLVCKYRHLHTQPKTSGTQWVAQASTLASYRISRSFKLISFILFWTWAWDSLREAAFLWPIIKRGACSHIIHYVSGQCKCIRICTSDKET